MQHWMFAELNVPTSTVPVSRAAVRTGAWASPVAQQPCGMGSCRGAQGPGAGVLSPACRRMAVAQSAAAEGLRRGMGKGCHAAAVVPSSAGASAALRHFLRCILLPAINNQTNYSSCVQALPGTHSGVLTGLCYGSSPEK